MSKETESRMDEEIDTANLALEEAFKTGSHDRLCYAVMHTLRALSYSRQLHRDAGRKEDGEK